MAKRKQDAARANPVRVPRQKRSIERARKIRAAARDLFYKNGYHNTSSNAIAARAGVPIGSFYSYFKNKKILFSDVLQEYKSRELERMARILRDTEAGPIPMSQTLNRLIAVIFDAHRVGEKFHHDVSVMKNEEASIATMYHEFENNEIGLVRKILETASDRPDTKDHYQTAKMTVFLIENMANFTLFGKEARHKTENLKSLKEILLVYLTR